MRTIFMSADDAFSLRIIARRSIIAAVVADDRRIDLGACPI